MLLPSTPQPISKKHDPTDLKVCAMLRDLDKKFDTSLMSPLHHDQRWCPIHNPRHLVD